MLSDSRLEYFNLKLVLLVAKLLSNRKLPLKLLDFVWEQLFTTFTQILFKLIEEKKRLSYLIGNMMNKRMLITFEEIAD